MATGSFISRREEAFDTYPPASASLALVVPFYGEAAVWVRAEGATGWHFPYGPRGSGETIREVADRELLDSTRINASGLTLIGALRLTEPVTTMYVYVCEVTSLSWDYEGSRTVAHLGVFKNPPRLLAHDWTALVYNAALRTRRSGLY